MADEDVCIFLSYAHDDDLTLSSSEDEVGFVTFLDKMLELKLRDLGATRAKIWIDRKRVSDGDLFDGAIDEGLYKAKLMLVIMSPNWMQRPYCRKELDAFCDLRKKAGVSSVQERMIVVGKGYVDRLKRPFELQGLEGFLFYARDDTNNVSDATPFFNRGKASEKFYDVRDKLAVFLQKRVDRIAEGGALGATLAQSQPIVSPNGRVVYLAKPASDMKAAYARVATELQGKGFTVVPGAAADLPSDSSALTAVKDALAEAEVSVHIVGERPGFAPEGLDPIVKLQLALAREKAAGSTGPTECVFRRIVWAPKVLDPGEPARAPIAERDPLQALELCDQQIATDKIDGGILSRFVEYLFQYLTETAPKPLTSSASGSKLELYLAYHGADEDYAEGVADALRDGPVKVRIPVAEADADARRFNSDLLVKCDAVTLCWANASEVWVRSEADKLSDWQGLGRKQQFAFRSLIAGPPPAPHKKPKAFDLLFQDGQFDKVLDLVEKGPPTRELLADLAPDGACAKP